MTEQERAEVEAIETWNDQLARVESMANPSGTWDLSDKDIAALRAVLDRLRAESEAREKAEAESLNQQRESATVRRHYLHEKACREKAEQELAALRKANEWRDANKELPELRRVATAFIADANWKGDSIVVLVFRPTFTCEPVTRAYLADFGDGPLWRHPNGQFVGNIYPVTHWRPLPAPPESAEIAPEDLKSNSVRLRELDAPESEGASDEHEG